MINCSTFSLTGFRRGELKPNKTVKDRGVVRKDSRRLQI
jgi:hypothetical protein